MVYILLGNGFETVEALAPADVLRRGNVPVPLVGASGATVTSAQGVTVAADVTLDQVKLAPGDLVMLPGGLGGVDVLEHDEAAMALIRQAAADPQVWLSAICAAPTLLARWGQLEGKQAVCFPGMEDQMKGTLLRPEAKVVEDGDRITGRAAGSAFDFGLALVRYLAGADKADEVRRAVHY